MGAATRVDSLVDDPRRGLAGNVDQGRSRHDRIAVELERVKRSRPRGQPQKVTKRGLLGPRVVRLLRPAERFQQAAGIEDAARRPLGPVGLDQSHQVHVIELPESGGRRFHQLHAATPAPWRRRPAFNLVMDERGQIVGRPAAVVVETERPDEIVERGQHRGARPDLPIVGRVVRDDRFDRAFVPAEKARDRFHLIGSRLTGSNDASSARIRAAMRAARSARSDRSPDGRASAR